MSEISNGSAPEKGNSFPNAYNTDISSYEKMPEGMAVPPPAQQPVPQYMQQPSPVSPPVQAMQPNTKFCKFCAARIPMDAVICTACGRQVEQIVQQNPQPVVINNTNLNTNNNNNNVGNGKKACSKWTAFLLCLFLGYLGVHKFYEGRVGSGILYLCTFGLCGIGWIIDILALLLKPNPYYV